MVGKSFATLSWCVLLYCTTQVEFAHTPTFHALIVRDEQRNAFLRPIPLPLNRSKDGSGLISISKWENLRDIRAVALKLPAAKFLSWSHNISTFLGMPLIQQNCLTTAVYFEARSEPVLGQLAVATVVLNRVKSTHSSICGVVYKGSGNLNSCQFSFACDGKTDVVDDADAWREALEIGKS